MVNFKPSELELKQEVDNLRYQLSIAEETLRAIGNGEVDALVIAGSQGEQVYTLQGADSSYRLLVEEMKEGAATITTDSTLLLYCNKRLAALVKTPLKKLIGSDFKQFISPSDIMLFEALCQKASLGSGKGELILIAADGTEVPVYLSISILNQKGVEVGCLIVTDLSEQKRDEELIAQERLTRLLLEQAAESIIVCDHQGKIIRASEEAHKILGKNLLLSNFDDMVKLELLPNSNGGQSGLGTENNSMFSIASVINGNPYKGQEVLFLRDDGKTFNFLMSASPLSIPHSSLKGCVVILTNITERKWAEEALKKINEDLEIKVSERTAELESLNHRLKQELLEQARTQQILQDQAQLLDLANDGIVAVDLNNNITYWSQGAEKLYGYSKLEALGKNLVKILNTKFPKPLDKIHQEVFEQGNWEGELIQTNRQGNIVVIHSSWSLKKDGDGNPIAILKINRDITKAKQAEQAIIDSGLRLAGILDMAQDAIISINEEQQITLFNQGAEKIFGYTANEVLKQPFCLLISKTFIERNYQSHLELLSSNCCLFKNIKDYSEVIGRRKDGTEFPAEVSISELFLDQGKILTVFMRDISDRKQVELAIQKSQEDLEIKVQERTLQLATSNDELIREIAERKLLENQLHQINEELEERVEQRTQELAQAINDLQQEAIERQKATVALQESEARFRAAIDGSLDAFFLLQNCRDEAGKSIDFILVDMNSKAEEMISQNKESLLGKGLYDIFPWGQWGYFDKYLRGFKTHKGFEEELAVSDPNVKAKWVQLQVVPLFDGLAVTCRDITERKQTQEAAQQANEKLTRWVNDLKQRNRETVLLGQMSEFLQACNSTEEAYQVINELLKPFFPHVSGSLFVTKNSKNLVEMVASWGNLEAVSESVFSPQDCWALRRGRSHFVGSPKSHLLCKHIYKKLHRSQLKLINSSEIGRALTTAIESSGVPLPAVEHLCIPMTAQGDALGLLCLASQEPGQLSEDQQRLAIAVAEHIALALANLKLREALEYQSIRDSLTGLYNRRYLEESLEREISRAQRQKFCLGVMMIDIDHFKHYNDNYGHDAGDIVLQKLGAFLQQHIRGSDIACRYGGEEFTLILPEVSLEILEERAETIRIEVQNLKLQHHYQDLGQITLSLGLAIFPAQGVTGESILRAADAALYQAKQQGRNQVCLFSKTCDHLA